MMSNLVEQNSNFLSIIKENIPKKYYFPELLKFINKLLFNVTGLMNTLYRLRDLVTYFILQSLSMQDISGVSM